MTAVCGLTAFFLIFANAVVFTEIANVKHFFTGVQAALGYSLNGKEMIGSSAGIILAYVFPLFGACIMIFDSMMEKNRKIVFALVSALMVTGGILALCAVKLLNGSYFGEPSLAGGAIASGICSLVGGASACAAIFLKG